MDAPAYNMPLVAPAFRQPPYQYNHIRRLTIVLEADPARMKRFIPEPLEYVSNRFVVWLEHRVDEHPGPTPLTFASPFDTHEASVDIPVRFRGQEGTHIPMMWVPTSEADFARAMAGRDLQGIGKKTAHFSWDERIIDNEIHAKLIRNNVNVIDVSVKLEGDPAPKPTKSPIIQVKAFPRVDGTGYDMLKVIALDKWEFNEKVSRGVKVTDLSFGESAEDPLYELRPTKIIGGIFTVWTGTVHGACGRELADLLAEQKAGAAAKTPVAAGSR